MQRVLVARRMVRLALTVEELPAVRLKAVASQAVVHRRVWDGRQAVVKVLLQVQEVWDLAVQVVDGALAVLVALRVVADPEATCHPCCHAFQRVSWQR